MTWIESSNDKIEPFILAIHNLLQTLHLDPTFILKAELLFEEILMNISLHAYPKAKGIIKVDLTRENNLLHCQVTDEGLPFNPLSYNPPPSSHTTVGGRGCQLILHLAPNAHYERESEENHLRFSLPLLTF